MPNIYSHNQWLILTKSHTIISGQLRTLGSHDALKYIIFGTDKKMINCSEYLLTWKQLEFISMHIMASNPVLLGQISISITEVINKMPRYIDKNKMLCANFPKL